MFAWTAFLLAVACAPQVWSSRAAAAADPVPCGQARPRFHGSLCGPLNNPCGVRRDEIIPQSVGLFNEAPDLAVTAKNEPRILLPFSGADYSGFYIGSTAGRAWVVEGLSPGLVGASSFALDSSDTAYALLDDGVLGHGFWQQSSREWEQLDHFGPNTFAAYAGNLKRDDAGCFHTGVRVDEVPTYARRTDVWSFEPLAEATGVPPSVALASSGRPHAAYFVGEDAEWKLYWAAPPDPSELVVAINSDFLLAYPAPLGVTGAAEGRDVGTPHLLTIRYSDDYTRAELVYATRRADRSWQILSLGEGSVNDPFGSDLCPGHRRPEYEIERCSYQYVAYRPFAVVTSGHGDVRAFYTRFEVQADLHAVCEHRGEPGIFCEWDGPVQVTGTLMVAWPSDGGLVQQPLLYSIVPRGGTAMVDDFGRIHLAISDQAHGLGIRYLLIKGAAADACPGDCDLNNAVTIDDLVTSLGVALAAAPLESCPAGDRDRDGLITVDELLRGVGTALNGCLPRQPSTYTLTGVLSGSAAEGELQLVADDRVEPNLVSFTVPSFAFGDLTGTGTAEFFTLDNSFTLKLTVHAAPEQAVFITGRAHVEATGYFTFGEFTAAGDGYELQFSALANVSN